MALLLAAAALPASAQDLGFFGRLFGGTGQQQTYGNNGNDQQPQTYHRRRRASTDTPIRRSPSRSRPQLQIEQAQEPAKKALPKNATVFVDVFGDTFGQLLANGLDDALADKPEVGVVHLGRGPSGLVNTSYYDWQKTIDDLLARQGKHKEVKRSGPDQKAEASKGKTDSENDKPDADKPATDRIDVAVMMIGSNDRQPITDDGKRLDPGSDEWTAVYRKRALAIAEAFQKKKVPLIWVGVPIVKNDDFADDMAALNDIYRDVAARTGATYVDTWEPFSDADGEFSAYGPDVDGQNVRLRTAEGIYFTKAGARKLAHFVEAPIRHDLEGRAAPPELPIAVTPPDAVSPKDSKPNAPAVAVVKPDAGPIKNLAELPAAKDGRLSDVASFKGEAGHPSVDRTQIEAAPAGRADDFRWPPDGVPAR